MALDDKLERGASILFDDDPLANMVARGFGRGLTTLGRAAKTGLQNLRRKPQTPEDDTEKVAPQREMPDNTSNSQEHWTWLKDILSNIADDISSIKHHLVDQDKQNQAEDNFEKLKLMEDELENKKQKPQLITTKETDEDDTKSSKGILGFLGTILSKIISMIKEIFSSFVSLFKMFTKLPIILSGLLPLLLKIGAVSASLYAASKAMQKITPHLNDFFSWASKKGGSGLMELGEGVSWLKSKFSDEENYTKQYEKLFSQENPEESMFTEGALDKINEFFDPNYKDKRNETLKQTRIEAELRAGEALDQDIKSREDELKSLQNVPDMVGPDGTISKNSASIRRENLSGQIEGLKNKKQQFQRYLSAKSNAGLDGRWIESVLDKSTGEIINNPLAKITKDQNEEHSKTTEELKTSNEELKESINRLNDTMKGSESPKGRDSSSATDSSADHNLNIPTKNLDPAFVNKVQDVSKRLGIKPEWLMAAMEFETAGTFSPSQKNFAGSSGTGLIQFMDETAAGLGTSTGELAKMSQTQQLDYVEKYLKTYSKRIKSPEDLYMSILRPASIGKSNEHVLFRRGDGKYEPNRRLDKDRDGNITKSEASDPVVSRVAKYSPQPIPKPVPDIITDTAKRKQPQIIEVGANQPVVSKKGATGGPQGPMSPIDQTDEPVIPGSVRQLFLGM